MSFNISIGGGKQATVNEPTRGMFPGNLGGAVSYSFAFLVYKVMEVMGGAAGAFLAGLGVQFLERIEPSLVFYARPLIDMILDMPNLDPHLKTFFTQLREPTHEGAATLLTGLADSAGGAVFGSVLGVLLSPLTLALNRLIRPAIPDPSIVINMYRRGLFDQGQLDFYLGGHGYEPGMITRMLNVSQQRVGIVDWIEGRLRGVVSIADVAKEAWAQGIEPDSFDLMLKLRQRLMNFQDMLPALYRGDLSEAQLRETMGKQGWTDADLTTMLKAAVPLPSLSDVITLAVREAWRDDVAARWGYDEDFPGIVSDHIKKLGFDPDWAKRFWRAHWALPSVTYATEMVHRGIITVADFKDLLRIADFPAGWRGPMTEAIYTPYTRVDVRRMFRLGVLTYDEMVAAYKAIGYDNEKAGRLADFTVKYEAEDLESKPEKYKILTLAAIEQGYLKGVISGEEFRARLLKMPYPAEEIELIVSLAELKRTVQRTPDYKGHYQDDVIRIVGRSFTRGMIDAGTAGGYLAEVGITAEESEYVLAAAEFAATESQREDQLNLIGEAYRNRSIDYNQAVALLGKLALPGKEQEILLANWDMTMEIGTRRLTEPQYRAAWKKAILTKADYLEACQGLGFADADIEILVKLYESTG